MIDQPRKAYLVELHARVVKTAIVWADSAKDAKRRYLDADSSGDSENVMVLDNGYDERGLRNVRRMPSEDRP